MKRWVLGVSLFLSLLTCAVNRALAWTMATHQKAASGAATALPPGALRDLLLANEGYLRGGAVGPDIFYWAHGSSLYSKLAHYCKTDELAKAMLAAARSDQAKAFAYGWFSHNVADSVAHPWVNGYTGQPYEDLEIFDP